MNIGKIEGVFIKPEKGIEPSTYALRMRRSTIELFRQILNEY